MAAVELRSDAALFGAGAALAVAVGWVTARPGTETLVVAGAAAAVAAAFAFRAPRGLLFVLLVWLPALGLLRRLLPNVAFLGNADPLLLVAPVGLALLVMVAFKVGRPIRRTSLSSSVAVLSLLIVAAAVNPVQGSPLAGVSGLLFVLVPTLGFWVGRSLLDDDTFRAVLTIVAVLVVAVACYGLLQTFDRFPSWDADWIRAARGNYASLEVLGATRPFSTFSASAEYGFYLAIGAVAWLVIGTSARRPFLTAAVLGLLAIAAVYQSSRGVIVAFAFAVAMAVSARLRLPLAASVVTVVAMLALLVAGARAFAPSAGGAQSAAGLAAHQARGLADPLNPESSTLAIHLRLIGDGIASVASQPLGVGLGPITIAGRRFGGLERGTEADPSNAAVAMGLPGLLAYAAVASLGLVAAYRLARRRRDALAVGALAILCVTLFQWLNGGQYAVALLPWLVLGWVDRTTAETNA